MRAIRSQTSHQSPAGDRPARANASGQSLRAIRFVILRYGMTKKRPAQNRRKPPRPGAVKSKPPAVGAVKAKPPAVGAVKTKPPASGAVKAVKAVKAKPPAASTAKRRLTSRT
ncbi:MAG: hypothetical protein QOD62_2243, partial [Actinomycetota bacterium]|nr:hypothetical protein [Actinomycetota bacterium]